MTPEVVFLDAEPSGVPFVACQYAQLLRVVRAQPASGAAFHLANFEYWNETASFTLSNVSEFKDFVALQIGRMSSQLLVSIVHAVHRSGKSHEVHLLAETVQNQHNEYLTLLQRRSHSKDYAISWLDAVDVFAIGVCVCYLSSSFSSQSSHPVAISRPTRVSIELLTLASERFPDARVFAELLSMLVDVVVSKDRRFAPILEDRLRQAIENGVYLPARDRALIRTTLVLPNDILPFVSTGT